MANPASDTPAITVIVTHPIQYFAPLFVELAATVDLEVAYFTTNTVKGYFDEGFKRAVQWDVDLMSGYRSRDLGVDKRYPQAADALRLRRAIGDLLDARRDSVVLVFGWTWPYLLALEEAWRRDMPSLIRAEATDLVNRSLWSEIRRQLVLRPILSRVDAFAVIGSMARDSFRRLGVSDDAMCESHYTIDDRRFMAALDDARPARADWRRRWNLAADDIVYLFVAKLSDYKRPLDLVRAFALARKRVPKARLVFVGDGDLADAVDALTAELGVSNFVRRTGFQNQSELPHAYAASDVFVLPSIEPWGLVMNEAALAGLPLIATELVGAAHDLVVPGLTGSRFAPGDINALADAMELWADPERRGRARLLWPDILSKFGIHAAAEGIKAAARLAARRHGGSLLLDGRRVA